MARRYEFYVRVARTILLLPQEHKIHIFEPTCNVLFIIWRLYSKLQTRHEKPIQQKQKTGIVTSLNDATLTKVTYGKYATRVPVEVACGIYKWFSSQ